MFSCFSPFFCRSPFLPNKLVCSQKNFAIDALYALFASLSSLRVTRFFLRRFFSALYNAISRTTIVRRSRRCSLVAALSSTSSSTPQHLQPSVRAANSASQTRLSTRQQHQHQLLSRDNNGKTKWRNSYNSFDTQIRSGFLSQKKPK